MKIRTYSSALAHISTSGSLSGAQASKTEMTTLGHFCCLNVVESIVVFLWLTSEREKSDLYTPVQC